MMLLTLTLLQKSSLSFLLPTGLALASGRWFVACATALLTYTSARYHGSRPPSWIEHLDKNLSRTYTCVYSYLAFVGWVNSGYTNTWFLRAVLGGVATTLLYSAEHVALARNMCSYTVILWMHVCVQQAACFACISYLLA